MTIKAHSQEILALAYPPVWKAASASEGRYHRPLEHCSFCGSISPQVMVNAILSGASIEWVDAKRGLPHKAYVNNIPNPFKGVMEAIGMIVLPTGVPPSESLKKVYNVWNEDSQGSWVGQTIRPAYETTHSKFYSMHLKDCTEEQLKIIQDFLKLKFVFGDSGKVSWEPKKA